MRAKLFEEMEHFEDMPSDRLLDLIRRLDDTTRRDQALLAAARKVWRLRQRKRAARQAEARA